MGGRCEVGVGRGGEGIVCFCFVSSWVLGYFSHVGF